MATAIVSLASGRKIKPNLGMTGEITLRGRVLPVGGLREKVLAAHRAGLKVVILPEKNQKDLVEVPKKVREVLKIIPVHHMDQVIEIALAPKPAIEPPRPRRKQDEAEEGQPEGTAD